MSARANMPRGAGVLLLAAMVSVMAAGGQAQDGSAVIPLAPAGPAGTAMPEPVAPVQVTPPDTGLIQLPAATTEPAVEGSPPDAGPYAGNDTETATTPATPIALDRSGGEAVASAGWLIRPRPVDQLANGVLVGASLSAPGILRLTGEVADTTLVIDLPPGAPLPDSLQLTLHSSVNVLPEQARMRITVNEADPVEIALDRLGDFSTLTVPTDALRAGANRIALSVHQPHRIFCGPEATFGVWTEIDLGQSGVFLSDAALRPDPAGFAMAARSETAGGRSLMLLADEATDPAIVRNLSEQLSRALGPGGRVGLSSFYTLARQPIASVALIASDAPRAEIRQGAGRGLVLQVEYQGDTLPDLTALLAEFPPAATLAAPLVRPGEKMRITELGSGDIIGNTHYFRRDVPFTMPAEWLLMANQKARVDLHYGFARNLPQGAMLLVKINDETIRLLPLDEKGGEVLPVLPVGFNANMLHPGRNVLSFEMMVPGNPADSACPVRRTDLLAVLGDTALTVPPSPRMVLPGLSTALLRLAPSAVIAPPDAVERAKLEHEAMLIGAELTPAVQSQFTVRLQVVGLSDFGLVPFDETGLSLGMVQSALFPPLNRPEPEPEAVSTAEPQPARATFTLSEEAAPAVAPPVDQPGFASGVAQGIWQSLSPRAWIAHEYTALRDSAFVGTPQSLPDWLEGRTGTALLLRPDFEQRGELWLVLGPRAAPAEVGAALNRLRENSLAQGEAALLQADGSWQVWTPIRPPRLLALSDVGSARTVLGNYASWSPLMFTLAMLGLALLSALPALFYVLLSRRKGMGQ